MSPCMCAHSVTHRSCVPLLLCCAHVTWAVFAVALLTGHVLRALCPLSAVPHGLRPRHQCGGARVRPSQRRHWYWGRLCCWKAWWQGGSKEFKGDSHKVITKLLPVLLMSHKWTAGQHAVLPPLLYYCFSFVPVCTATAVLPFRFTCVSSRKACHLSHAVSLEMQSI